MQVHKLHRIDPVRKQAESGVEGTHGLSPMDPPDAYAPSGVQPVAPEDMHPLLRDLRAEHVSLLGELNAFEAAIVAVQESGYTRESDARLRRFFRHLDEVFTPHSRREEATLFPLLRERLITSGEHGVAMTAVEVMEDEHAKAMQLAAVIVNFLGLVFRLPDQRSALIVLDAALEQGRDLVELLRLHVFREDNIVFPLAHQLIATAEFDALQAGAAAAGETP